MPNEVFDPSLHLKVDGNGYARKSAVERFEEATEDYQQMKPPEKLIRKLTGRKVSSPLGLLHEEALVMQAQDRELALEAIKKGLPLYYLSEQLRDDKDIVLAAIKQGVKSYKLNNVLNALKNASERLRNDKQVVLAAVKKYGVALEFASKDLQNDKDVVLAAVSNYSRAFRYASDELRDNSEFVLRATKKGGIGVINFASPRIRNHI